MEGLTMADLRKVKQQYINTLAISLAEGYNISFKEAKLAINLSEFMNKLETFNEHDIKLLSNKSNNDIVNNIWSDYKEYCLV
jgi:hypothetical protein